MKKVISLGAILIVALFVFAKAQAQDVMQSIMDANASTSYNYMSTVINKDVMSNMYKNKGAAGSNSSKTFTYYTMPYYTGEVVKQVGARMKLNQSLINQLQRYDYNNLFDKLTQGFNLKHNDVADILTAYQVQSWLIANSATTDPSPQAVNALREQVRRSLATNTTVTTDGKVRAQLGEELKVLFVLNNAGWQGSKKQGSLKNYSDAIARNYQTQYHQDLRSLKLDDKGMHP